jgi:hypothetical protein
LKPGNVLRSVHTHFDHAIRILITLLLCAIALASPAAADTIDWASEPATNLLTTSHVKTFGTLQVTTTGTGAGSVSARVIAVSPTVTRGTITGVVDSQIDATTDNGTVSTTTTFTFSEPVYNLTFTIADIDASGGGWNDIVQLSPVPTSAPFIGSNVNYNAATGRATNNGASVPNTSTIGNLTVTFAGPVTTFSVQFIAGAISPGTNAFKY